MYVDLYSVSRILNFHYLYILLHPFRFHYHHPILLIFFHMFYIIIEIFY
eukprot:UN16094